MSEATNRIAYEELAEAVNKYGMRMCLICTNRGNHNCDAGAGYTTQDEYGECPSGDLDACGDSMPEFEVMSKEEYEKWPPEEE